MPSENTQGEEKKKVSVIDATSNDPVAVKIHEELTTTLEQHLGSAAPSEENDERETKEAANEETLSDSTASESGASSDSSSEQQEEEDALPNPVAKMLVPPSFISVNIMESIVRDSAPTFMKQFGVCECERCKADVVALTLNGLQPKYVVASPEAGAPLLSYFSNHYTVDVTVELTKACQIVKDNPRHHL